MFACNALVGHFIALFNNQSEQLVCVEMQYQMGETIQQCIHSIIRAKYTVVCYVHVTCKNGSNIDRKLDNLDNLNRLHLR